MPFGLCNVLATFQWLMERVLAGLQWSSCLVYLDDIIVYSRSVEEHLTLLGEVFACLRKAGLKIKPSKCHLLQTSVCYLGHVVSAKGVETDPKKIRCIADWPIPSSLKDLQSFLGLASYYRRSIRNFAHIASPLHALAHKERDWVWTPQCKDAFFELKKVLTSAPVLVLPNFRAKFVLDTDASDDGLGAVLSKVVGGRS